VISAVIDTSVLVSAFIGRPEAGPSQIVAAWREGRFALVASPRLLDELREVLSRAKFARWSAEGRGEMYAAAFAATAQIHDDPPASPATRDPADDYLVALARSANADLLVSVDRDLLEANLSDVTVISPADFLARLAQ
jgi:putative PIN family toxin of toxin-antitoxin system